MDKQPNLYERFIKDIHPELIDQFKQFIKEKDIYKQFIKFAHPEFGKDFKKYTEKMPAYNSYRVARFYVNHPDFPKNYYYLDVGVEDQTGKYILLNKEGKPLNNYLFDNIGILSYAAGSWRKTSYFGIYVKKGDSYAFLKKSEDNEELLDYLEQGTVLSEFLDYGLPHYKFEAGSRDDRIFQMFAGMKMQWLKDETIILDKNTKLVPDFEPDSYHTTCYRLGVKVGKDDWEARNVFYVGKLPSYHSDKKDRLLSSFLEKWNKADNKQKAKLRKGLGYNIGFK